MEGEGLGPMPGARPQMKAGKGQHLRKIM